MDDFESAIETLRRRRAGLADQLRRLDLALAALTGDDEGGTVGAVATAASGEAHAKPRQVRVRRSVKARVVAVLQREPDRDFSATEIMEILIEQGTPAHREGRDPTSPIRTALRTAFQDGLVDQVEVGRYRAVADADAGSMKEIAASNGSQVGLYEAHSAEEEVASAST